jgi:uncharacterized RmlC-like cupin family protein
MGAVSGFWLVQAQHQYESIQGLNRTGRVKAETRGAIVAPIFLGRFDSIARAAKHVLELWRWVGVDCTRMTPPGWMRKRG